MRTKAIDRFIDILKNEGRRIADEFELASQQGEGTPQEVSDFREHAVQGFISRFLPQSHVVSKGKVTDLEGNQSDSIDCLILNPAHPNLIDSKGKFRLIFSDGCDAAIEVKPNLARADELQRGLHQGQSVKRTKRSESPLLMRHKQPQHILNHSCYIPYFIFSVKAFSPENLWQRVAEFHTTLSVPLEEQLDAIFINGNGILKNVKHAELNLYGNAPHLAGGTGWYYEKWKEATLVGLLLSLGESAPAVAPLSSTIIQRVVRRSARFEVSRFGDLV